MNARLHEQVRALFLRCLELSTEERAELLARESGPDPALRREVEDLLLEHERDSGFGRTDRLSAKRPSLSFEPPEEEPPFPEHIGGYQVLELLGQGGMGRVYLAEQANPRRRVALKIVQPGLASPARLRRFEHEAELLGRLHHPGIAQIYEAGTANAGFGPQPFFAMELVRGKPIDSFARERGLGTRERLSLLVEVCQAVQHAHQQGVIHRDLKPANILVEESGAPKVLDFGVARSMDSDVQLASTRTEVGQIVGTLPYMSPEQLAGDSRAVDTRSDVYALGVIGYELLAHRLPHDVRTKSLPEAARAIREDEPTRLSSVDRLFRGDVETIFDKALAKEKERRYGSAAELAADIERYLREQPILARAPSTFYHLSKFARRNKALVGAAAFGILALVAAVVGTTSQAIRAGVQRDRALAAGTAAQLDAERAEHASAEAARETRRAEATYQFLVDMLSSANPDERGHDVRVVEVLDTAARELDSADASEPEVEASLRYTLGLTFRELGLWDKAEPQLRRAEALHRQLYGPSDRRTLDAMSVLGQVLARESRLDEAEPLLREVLEQSARAEGEVGREVASAARNLALLELDRGRYDVAESLSRDALARSLTTKGSEKQSARLLQLLSEVLERRESYDEAGELASRALELARALTPADATLTLTLANNLAGVRRKQNRFAEARALYEESLAGLRRRAGDDHPDTIAVSNNLALALRDEGECWRAASVLEDELARIRRTRGERERAALGMLNNLGDLYERLGVPERAGALYDEFLALVRTSPASEDPLLVRARDNMVHFYADTLHRYDLAADVAGELVALVHIVFPTDLLQQAAAEGGYGYCLWGLGRLEEAEPLILHCYETIRDVRGPSHPFTRGWLKSLIDVNRALDRPDKVAEYRELLARVDER